MDKMKLLRSYSAEEVAAKGWNRQKRPFSDITSEDIPDLPKMGEEDLVLFFIGSYQLSRAASLLTKMMNSDGRIHLKFLKENSKVLKMELQS